MTGPCVSLLLPDGTVVRVGPDAIVGRSAHAGARIDDARVSTVHAELSWRAEGFVLIARGGRLAVGGRAVREVVLHEGLEVALAPHVVVRVARVERGDAPVVAPTAGRERLRLVLGADDVKVFVSGHDAPLVHLVGVSARIVAELARRRGAGVPWDAIAAAVWPEDGAIRGTAGWTDTDVAGAVVLIAWQPDLGTATLVALIGLSVALLTARTLWPLFAGIGVVAASIPLLWVYVLHDYQKRRVLTFMDPATDPTGAGWHARQSIMAVGSGQWSGKGYMEGTQNQLNFLPEHWSDFPFSVWAEEWGFMGSAVLIGLYAFLILWTLHVASTARDRFAATVCAGVGALIFWHVFVNIAMVTGLAPVVGVTLPLVSHGGSSVLTIFIGLGLVASVSMRRFAR